MTHINYCETWQVNRLAFQHQRELTMGFQLADLKILSSSLQHALVNIIIEISKKNNIWDYQHERIYTYKNYWWQRQSMSGMFLRHDMDIYFYKTLIKVSAFDKTNELWFQSTSVLPSSELKVIHPITHDVLYYFILVDARWFCHQGETLPVGKGRYVVNHQTITCIYGWSAFNLFQVYHFKSFSIIWTKSSALIKAHLTTLSLWICCKKIITSYKDNNR